MSMLAADDIALMRADQALSRWDTCRRLVYTAGAVNAYGMPEPPTYVRGDAIACGLDMKSRRIEVEAMGSTQVIVSDARLRLPVSTTVDNRDRIEITYRFAEALGTPLVYELIGEPERGPSGLVVNLRLATDGQGAA
jgi:hypothetical protein